MYFENSIWFLASLSSICYLNQWKFLKATAKGKKTVRNTLIYLNRTLGKFLVWPEDFCGLCYSICCVWVGKSFWSLGAPGFLTGKLVPGLRWGFYLFVCFQELRKSLISEFLKGEHSIGGTGFHNISTWEVLGFPRNTVLGSDLWR